MASFRRAQIFLADGKMWGLLRRQGRVIPETHVPTPRACTLVQGASRIYYYYTFDGV